VEGPGGSGVEAGDMGCEEVWVTGGVWEVRGEGGSGVWEVGRV